MPTKLEEVIKSIHPSKTIEPIAARADRALDTFGGKFGIIHKWEEFTSILATLYRRVENAVLAINPPLPSNHEIDWGRCVPLLDELYGRNGIKVAMEMAESGAEGGIYRVLKDLAMKSVEKYARSEISTRVNRYWSQLTADERVAVPEEYLTKFGNILPSEFVEGNTVLIRRNFRKVLEEHPFIVSRLRSIGR